MALFSSGWGGGNSILIKRPLTNADLLAMLQSPASTFTSSVRFQGVGSITYSYDTSNVNKRYIQFQNGSCKATFAISLKPDIAALGASFTLVQFYPQFTFSNANIINNGIGVKRNTVTGNAINSSLATDAKYITVGTMGTGTAQIEYRLACVLKANDATATATYVWVKYFGMTPNQSNSISADSGSKPLSQYTVV